MTGILKSTGVDLKKVDTIEEQREQRLAERIVRSYGRSLPSINSREGVEYYTGESYGDR